MPEQASFPSDWLPRVWPRRGGVVPPPLPEPGDGGAAWGKLVERVRPDIDMLLRSAASDPGLVASCSQENSCEFAALAIAVGWRRSSPASPVDAIDSLIGLRGLGWAARSVAEAPSFDARATVYQGRNVLEQSLTWAKYSAGSLAVPLAEMAGRVRRRLVSAPDDTEAIAWLEPLRAWSPETRAVCSFLVPARRDWFDAGAKPFAGDLLQLMQLGAASTPQEARGASMRDLFEFHPAVAVPVLATLLDALGPGLVSVIEHWWAPDQSWLEYHRALADGLAHIDADEAMASLAGKASWPIVVPYLRDAAERFPERAAHMSVQAEAGAAPHPGLAEAAPADVPQVLARPPWEDRPKPVKRAVLDLTPPDLCEACWLAGERESWLVVPTWATREAAQAPSDPVEWERTLTGTWASGWTPFLALAPLELVEPHLDYLWPGGYSLAPRVLARQTKVDLAAAQALRLARENPNQDGGLIVPFATPEIAALVAEWLDWKGVAHQSATAWLRRRPYVAATLLLPAVLGKAGKRRSQADRALMYLVNRGFSDEIRAAADQYGPEAARATDAFLAIDPLGVGLPATMPQPPHWLSLALLPQIAVPVGGDGGVAALPQSAVSNLVAMAQISTLDAPYAGIDVVARSVDRTSLAGFARAVFQSWAEQDYPSKDGWVLDFQGLVGDDETVRVLAPLIWVWPLESAQRRAVKAMDVLLAIGSDLALRSLHRVAQQSKSKGTRREAANRIEHLAQERGLSSEQLADRLVPDFGLGADGRTRLDFGDRQFIVGFDHLLRPVIFDADGTPRKSLPKPSSEPGISEVARFATFKKDVRQVATDQLRRLEQAMVFQRSWTFDEFVDLLVKQPLVWNLTRRLVWVGENGAFRVAEDRTFADVEDAQVTPVGPIRLAHPLLLGADATRAWSAVFADYEILQPFAQLARDAHTVDEVAPLVGATAPTLALVGLERRGWRRSPVEDGGIQQAIERPLPDGRMLSIECDPGFFGSAPADLSNTQKLGEIDVAGLDRVMISEIVRDLGSVIA